MTSMFSISNLSKSLFFGSGQYVTRCIGRIVGDSRPIRCLMVKVRFSCPSNIDCVGINTSKNPFWCFECSSRMTINLRLYSFFFFWEAVDEGSRSVLMVYITLESNGASWNVFRSDSEQNIAYLSSFKCPSPFCSRNVVVLGLWAWLE